MVLWRRVLPSESGILRLREMDAVTGAPVRMIRGVGSERPPSADVIRFGRLPEERRLLLMHVSWMLDSIQFGTVVVVLQDAKVIQVEMSEKIRLP